MAEQDAKPPIPLGAQILRKMYSGCKALGTDLTALHGQLDESEAKSVIGEHLGSMAGQMSAIEKHFSKAYKGIDLEDATESQEQTQEDATPAEAVGDLPPAEADPKPDKTPQIETKADDGDDDDDMDPTEKGMLLNRLNKAASKIRHAERLQRVAANRR